MIHSYFSSHPSRCYKKERQDQDLCHKSILVLDGLEVVRSQWKEHRFRTE